MNIFYIGPYRQDNFDGILSRNIVKSLGEKHNVFARPIYYDGNEIVSDLDSQTQLYEDNNFEKYDCLVQHVKPMDCLHTSQFDRNILVPIIDKIYDVGFFLDHTIDKVLIDNTNPEDTAFDNNKTENFGYNLYVNIQKDRIFDIGPLNSLQKLYFIGEYKINYDLILGLIRSFIHLRGKISQEYCLVLFAINITQNDISFIQNYIQQTYKSLNATHTVNRIVIIPISMNSEQIVAAHNSGDIFLNFNHCPYNQTNKKIAETLNKKIINKTSMNITSSLFINDAVVNQLQPCLSDKDIIDNIINYLIDEKIDNKPKTNKSHKHIADLV